jgi:hypothetical protein
VGVQCRSVGLAAELQLASSRPAIPLSYADRTVRFLVLPGYIAEVDDSLDWLLDHQGSFEHEAAEPAPMSAGGAYEGFYEGVRALAAGSATYEWIIDPLDVAGGGQWPYLGKPFRVLSSRELRLPEDEGVDIRIVDASVGELYGTFRNGMVELRYATLG